MRRGSVLCLALGALVGSGDAIAQLPGGKYGGRVRGATALGRGGGRPIAKSITLGLDWLAKHQLPDGRWKGGVSDIATTSCALLAFMGNGSSLTRGPHAEHIALGIKWLDTHMNRSGMIGDPVSGHATWEHALATLALVEAMGLSREESLTEKAQKAVDCLVKARNEDGWGFVPRDKSSHSAVLPWVVMALRAAKDFRLAVPDDALGTAAEWLERVTDPKTGRVVARPDGAPTAAQRDARLPGTSERAMTASCLFSRVFLGQVRKFGTRERAAGDFLREQPLAWDGRVDMHACYFSAYAMFQLGGSHWKTWHRQLPALLVKTQSADPANKGSWAPVGRWSKRAGRAHTTALAVLTLQVYYRYTRLVR